MTDPVLLLRDQLNPPALDLREGFDDLGRGLRARSRRRRRLVAVSAATAALVGGAGVAVATGGSHTGLFGLPGMTENDTSEYLDTHAPDFRQVALGYAEGVDFAPGYSAEMYVGVLAPHSTEGEIVQVTGVRGWISSWAFCSWARTSTTDPVALRHMRDLASSERLQAINASDYDLGLVRAAEAGDPTPLQRFVTINCPEPTPWPAS